MYGSGYDCRKGIIHDKRRFGKDGNYLPDGLWNNVSAHVDWINDLVEKNLTEAVRRDFEITKNSNVEAINGEMEVRLR